MKRKRTSCKASRKRYKTSGARTLKYSSYRRRRYSKRSKPEIK